MNVVRRRAAYMYYLSRALIGEGERCQRGAWQTTGLSPSTMFGDLAVTVEIQGRDTAFFFFLRGRHSTFFKKKFGISDFQ